MEQAFRMARKADPAATLIYNDYNEHNPQKRAFQVRVLRDYLDRGVPIDAVGFQGHVGLAYPDLEEWERSLVAYADMGLKVHVSELEVDVLPSPYEMSAEISNRFQYSRENDPWPQGLPEQVQEQRYCNRRRENQPDWSKKVHGNRCRSAKALRNGTPNGESVRTTSYPAPRAASFTRHSSMACMTVLEYACRTSDTVAVTSSVPSGS